LLIDCDVNVELIPYLEAVGFKVVSALSLPQSTQSNDRKVLRWARRRQMIYVCHDHFKDKQTRIELYPELYERGGRIIQITGAPDQVPLESLGKIIINRERWRAFFKNNHGIAQVHSNMCVNRKSLELYIKVQAELGLVDNPEDSLKMRRKLNYKPVFHPPHESQVVLPDPEIPK
jgi:hypothetical protein